jgi:hypothetical protein
MSISDPIEIGLVVAGVSQVTKQAEDFIAAIAGRPGESIGTILGDIMRRRINNAEVVASKAHLTLLNLELKPREVPLEIMHPILEAAALQEDPSMQDIWANLLANAADRREVTSVSAVFPVILKELRTEEVRFLDALLDGIPKGLQGHLMIGAGVHFSTVLHIYQEANHLPKNDRGDITFSLELLGRHNIITTESVPQPINIGDKVARLPRGTIPRQLEVNTKELYQITSLGVRFVAACRPPVKSNDNPT